MHAMTKDSSNNKVTIKMEMRQDRCYIIFFHFYDKLTAQSRKRLDPITVGVRVVGGGA